MPYIIGAAKDVRFADTYQLPFTTESLEILYGNDTDGLVANAADSMDILNIEVINWLSATNIKVVIALANAIVDTVIIPAAAGTGVLSIALSGVTSENAGVYRIGIFSEGGEPIQLASDADGTVTVRLSSSAGTYTTPTSPLPAGGYEALDELWWAIQSTAAVPNLGIRFDCFDADSANAAIVSETLPRVRLYSADGSTEIANLTNVVIDGAGQAEIDSETVGALSDSGIAMAWRTNGDVTEGFAYTVINLDA